MLCSKEVSRQRSTYIEKTYKQVKPTVDSIEIVGITDNELNKTVTKYKYKNKNVFLHT